MVAVFALVRAADFGAAPIVGPTVGVGVGFKVAVGKQQSCRRLSVQGRAQGKSSERRSECCGEKQMKFHVRVADYQSKFTAKSPMAPRKCPGALVHNLEITPNAPTLYHHQAARAAVRAAIDALLERVPRPDAVMCCDDLSALSALERLREREVAVPAEIALVGFDDVPAAAAGLTTIRQPMVEVGRQAAQMLLERMQNTNLPVEKKVLPVELVVRQTA